MKISRHLHLTDYITTSTKEEITFIDPVEIEPSLGRDDPDIYRKLRFSGKIARSSIVEPETHFIHENNILQVSEIMAPGEILSIAIRPNYCLMNIVVDVSNPLTLLKWEDEKEGGLLYWFTIGKSGITEIIANLELDTDGIFKKIKANLRDIPLRSYFAKKCLASKIEILEDEYTWPEIMDTDTAAKYLKRSKSWLYGMAQRGKIKRTPDKHFKKIHLDEYLSQK